MLGSAITSRSPRRIPVASSPAATPRTASVEFGEGEALARSGASASSTRISPVLSGSRGAAGGEAIGAPC